MIVRCSLSIFNWVEDSASESVCISQKVVRARDC